MAASFVVELIFDVAMGSLILLFAFTQGVFPKPPDFAKLNAFDLSYLAQHPQLHAVPAHGPGGGALAAFALLSVRVKAFWERVRQGFTILRDRDRYFREVFLVQFGGWCFRFAAFWMLLEAFNVGGSVKNVLLVLGVNAVSAAVPFTPQGAGVQQALLVKVFAGSGAGAAVAAYSVGQQIAIGVLTFGIGFAALVFIFRVPQLQGGDRQRGRADAGYVPKPSRASRTRMTASGKSVCIAARRSCACCSALPWRLRRLMPATVMSTASLIALSAQATFCAPCIC